MWKDWLFPDLPSNKTVANAISAFGAGLCIYAGLLAWMRCSLLLVVGVFLLGVLMDVFDGWVARKLGEASVWGAYVDAFCDKLGEFGLLLGLACRADDPTTVRWFMAAAGLGLLGSYQKPLVAEKGGVISWPEAKLIGRGLRVTVMIGGLFVCGLGPWGDDGLRGLAQTLAVINATILVWREKRIQIAAFMSRFEQVRG